jgi:hypothetical protein
MNRQQRRAHKAHIEMVDLRQVPTPQELSEAECREIAIYRLGLNRAQTRHPYHHVTAHGAIVDADPTLEYMLSRLPVAQRDDLHERYGKHVSPDAKPAIPVNRKYYGHDPFAKPC